MGWSLGWDSTWKRDVGYGVPAYCDYPGCNEEINRGLPYVCCDTQMYGGENGCGRYYCAQHELLHWEDDEPTCGHPDDDYVSPEHPDWIHHKLTDESWQRWRDENPSEVAKLQSATPESRE